MVDLSIVFCMFTRGYHSCNIGLSWDFLCFRISLRCNDLSRPQLIHKKSARRLLRRRRESPPPLPATASSRRCTCRALKAGFRFFPASENMFRLFRLIYHQIYNVRPQRYLSWGPHNSNVTNWFMVRT